MFISPWSYAQQKMSQLSNVLGICTVTVKEMTLVYQLSQLCTSWTIVISWTQFYQRVANWWTGNHYNWNLVFNTESQLISNIKWSISHKNTNYFASINSLSSFLSFRYLDTDIHFHLNLTSPFQIFVRIVWIKLVLLTRKRWVCPFASYVPSTWEGFIFGNLIYPSGARPINFTPLLNVNFYKPEARPLSTIAASVLKAALAIPA